MGVQGTVNPQMVILARESRNMTQGELALAIGGTQGKVSKYENGMLSVSETDLLKIARATRYDPQFFYQRDEVLGLGSTFVFNRKRRAVSIRLQKTIQACANVMRMQADRLLRGAEIVSANQFERLDIDAFDGKPERIARYIRAQWRLPLGPISNITRVIESAGGVVFKCPFETPQIDAVHMWPSGLPPLFFMNESASGDRHRFNLAHELGHALMHRNVTGDCEEEADRFASEFLMPRDEIAKHLDSMTLEKAARLKSIWKVSMQSIIVRAHQLGKISDRLYTRLFQMMGAKGYRKREPIEIQFEEPATTKQLMTIYKVHHGYRDEDIMKLIYRFDPQFFSENEVPPPAAEMRLSIG